MHHGLHVRSRFVDPGVQMKLERRFAVTLEHVAIEIDRADVLDGELAALAGADVDEHRVLAKADARVPVVVDDVRALQHANAVDELLFRKFFCGHGHILEASSP